MTEMHEIDGVTPFLVPPDFPPPAAKVQVEFGARSRRGRSTTVNSDHYMILRMGRHQQTLASSVPGLPPPYNEYGYAMVVADGVGLPGGEVASRLAIETLMPPRAALRQVEPAHR